VVSCKNGLEGNGRLYGLPCIQYWLDGWMNGWKMENGGMEELGLDDNDFLLRFDSCFCIPAYIIS